MRLVLDTNILIAALIKKSLTREILIHPNMECLVSEFVFKEIDANKEEILKKSGMSPSAFEALLDNLKDKIVLVPDEEIQYKDKAQKIMRPIHINDALFIALALSTENDGIWSEDKHFEKQNHVKIWKTKDLIQNLGIKHT